MNPSVSITFRGMPSSPALVETIGEQMARLQRFASGLSRVEVTVGFQAVRRQRGKLYDVHLRALLQGAVFDVDTGSGGDERLRDPYLAVHEAFDALKRQLEDHVRIQRGEVKRHAADAAA